MGGPNKQRPIEGSVINLYGPAAAVRDAESIEALRLPLAIALEQIQAALDIQRVRNVAIKKVAEELVLNPPAGTLLEVNGVANVLQTLLNLIAGTNVTLTDNGVGGVTIDASSTLTPPVTLSAAIAQAILTLIQTGSGPNLTVTGSTAAAGQSNAIEVTGTPSGALLYLVGGGAASIRIDNSAITGVGGIIVQSKNAAAILSTSDSSFGVYATSNTSVGVRADSTSSQGVLATSTSGVGGLFTSNTNYALSATSFGTKACCFLNPNTANVALEIGAYGFAGLPSASIADGSIQYCYDAKNLVNDGVAVGTVAVGGGSGSMLVRLAGSWRTMA